MIDLLIEHADMVATCAGPAPRRGAAPRNVSALHRNITIAARDGTIVFVGPDGGLDGDVGIASNAVRIDARGCAVVPGFVDPHTHIVFGGTRGDELEQRLDGATYAEIAAAGGGILRTVAATRTATQDELVESARTRLDRMLSCGTTTCEVKSGYGLTLESELRLLQAIQRLNAEHDVDVVATFMGAHEVPSEYRSRQDDYAALVVREMIPAVAAASLAEWCDVFCEDGVFTPAQAEQILAQGRRAGLKPRIHANELGPSGGVRVACAVAARSADHLIFADSEDAEALAAASVCATLLPVTALSLRMGRYAPARMLIDSGVPVALGTDSNPAGGLSPSMPFAITLACFEMGMTLGEALIAATLNAAWSLDRADTLGSLEPGKLMDAIVIDGGLTELFRVAPSPVRAVIKRGRVVVGG
jgi:imidazolonepropionase